MARITVEDCLSHEPNRFALVRLASERAKQILEGDTPVTDSRGNKPIVAALREIADGKVRFRSGDAASTETELEEIESAPDGEQANGVRELNS